MPELRQLRTFLAVATELNFTRAAERLHLGQQAVSKAVRQLERELGVELFERSPHKVCLTAAGQALLEVGPGVLASADAAFGYASEAGRGLTGTVHVGVTPAIGPAEREEIVRLIRSEDDVSVSLLDVRAEGARALLRSRELDVVIARTCDTTNGLELAALRPTEAVLHMRGGHPLAASGTVRLAQLDGHRVLTWRPPGTAFTDLLLSQLAAAGAIVEPVQARVTGGTFLDLENTDAVALVPTSWPLTDGVARVRVIDRFTLPLLMLWPAGTYPQAVHRLHVGMSPEHGPSGANY